MSRGRLDVGSRGRTSTSLLLIELIGCYSVKRNKPVTPLAAFQFGDKSSLHLLLVVPVVDYFSKTLGRHEFGSVVISVFLRHYIYTIYI